MYYTILYYTILYGTVLYCTILYYTTGARAWHPHNVLYYTILYYTMLYYTILQYTTLHYTALHHTTLHYTTLHYAIPCPIINTNAAVLAFYLMLLAYASPGARAAAPVTAAPARRSRPRTPCHPAPGRIASAHASSSWFAPICD